MANFRFLFGSVGLAACLILASLNSVTVLLG